MEPRLVFTTHYQVDEPAYMEFLIKLCTSGVQSTYREVAARKLVQEINSRGKKLNKAAGGYAVDLARDLGLLTSNNVWSDKGFLLDLIAEVNDGELDEQLSLTTSERILHFRIFLEADGAAFLFLAKYLTQNTSLPPEGTTVNSLVQEMFIDILSDYLSVTNNTAQRVALRIKIDRLRREGYRGHSGAHKLYIHVQTLYRIGIIAKKGGSRIYHLPDNAPDMRQSLNSLLHEVPNIVALEKAISSHVLVELSANVLQIPYKPWERGYSYDILRLLSQNYKQIIQTGAPLCPLTTLLESIQITLLTRGLLLRYDSGLRFITEIQQRYTKDFRFHVDRRGQPAFVKISDDLIKKLASEGEAR